MDTTTLEMIRKIEKEREDLFRKFIEYTDLAERYNRMAYEITCQIEFINLALREASDIGIIRDETLAGDHSRSHVPRSASAEEEFEWDLFWEGGGPPGGKKAVKPDAGEFPEENDDGAGPGRAEGD